MSEQDERDIEEMTPGDWSEGGRWDASHTADPDLLRPYTPLDIAVWCTFHSTSVEETVAHLLKVDGEAIDYEVWAEQHGPGVTRDDYREWLAGYDAQASIMLCSSVQEHMSEAEHMTSGELRNEVRRLSGMSPRLPANNCAHLAAVYGARECCVCGAEVPRRNPTLDDIPVLE